MSKEFPTEFPVQKTPEEVSLTMGKNDSNQETEENEVGQVKKIEIPELGEVEYFEKKVMFPERIVQETGGVKGYIRKTIKWEEFGRLLSISPEKVELYKKMFLEFEKAKKDIRNEYGKSNTKADQKIMDAERDARPALGKWKGMQLIFDSGYFLKIVEALSEGNFPNETYNHEMFGYHGKSQYKDKDFKEEKFILQKIDFGIAHGDNSIRMDVIQFPQNEVIEKFAFSDDEELLKYKESKDPRYFFIGNTSISVSEKGKFWENLGPSPRNIVFGFGNKNKVFQKYRNMIDEKIPRKLFRGEEEVILGKGEANFNHPRIAVIKNHPEIQEPRWCFADYAAFSTRNGYNVLEMIT